MVDIFRCNCPITSALDIVGDKWTLVIIKQMLLTGQRTFKDFSENDEAIASNILSSRLKKLEEYKIITKNKSINNKKTNIYILTKKGIDLIPTILEIFLWSDENIRAFHPEMTANDNIEDIKKDKQAFIRQVEKNYHHMVKSHSKEAE